MKALKVSLLSLFSGLAISCTSPATPTDPTDTGVSTGEPTTVLSPPPTLLSPPDGAVLDNGCDNPRTDWIVWEFDWADVPGATRYRLIVERSGARLSAVDVIVSHSFYQHAQPAAYIIEQNRFNWMWGVQAEVKGVWSDPSARRFSVEPLNTDCR